MIHIKANQVGHEETETTAIPELDGRWEATLQRPAVIDDEFTVWQVVDGITSPSVHVVVAT